MLARQLLSRRKIDALWARPLSNTVWRFLPESVKQFSGEALDTPKILSEVVQPAKSGVLVWNVIRAIGLPRGEYPQSLFSGKHLAGIVFDGTDLSGLSFENSELYDVVFDGCNLAAATFRSCTVHRAKFFECGKGALVDESLKVREDSQVEIKRSAQGGVELYKGESIRTALCEIFREQKNLVPLPRNVADKAALLIFSSLFKSDMKRLDYPEWSKVENRIRAWLRSFQLSENQLKAIAALLIRMANELREEGWISKNPNRPRTFVPNEPRRETIASVLRHGTVRNSSSELEKIIRTFQNELDVVAQDGGA